MSRRGAYWWPPELAAVVDELRAAGWTVHVEHQKHRGGGGWPVRRGGRRTVHLWGWLGASRGDACGHVQGTWRADPGGDLERVSFEGKVGSLMPGTPLEPMTPMAILAATARLRREGVVIGDG